MLQPTSEKTSHGRGSAIHLLADFRDRLVLQVVKLDGQPLICGQSGQRVGNGEQLFLTHHVPARRGRIRG